MIRNKNMTRDTRKQVFAWRVDLDGAADTPGVILDPECDLDIQRIDIVYSVATNTGTFDNVQVGTAASATKWLDFTPTASQSLGTVAAGTVASTDLVSAGTPVLITRAGTSGNNTGEVTVVIHYERIDTRNIP